MRTCFGQNISAIRLPGQTVEVYPCLLKALLCLYAFFTVMEERFIDFVALLVFEIVCAIHISQTDTSFAFKTLNKITILITTFDFDLSVRMILVCIMFSNLEFFSMRRKVPLVGILQRRKDGVVIPRNFLHHFIHCGASMHICPYCFNLCLPEAFSNLHKKCFLFLFQS